jgi:hypothetical protein
MLNLKQKEKFELDSTFVSTTILYIEILFFDRQIESKLRFTNKFRPNSLREKRVVAAPTYPMCKGEIIGVISHRLWKGLVVNL